MEHNIILCMCMCSINKYYNNCVHVIACTCHCVYMSVCVHVTVYTCHCVHVIVCMYMSLCVYVIVCTYHLKFLRSADFNIIDQCANYKYIRMYVYKSSLWTLGMYLHNTCELKSKTLNFVVDNPLHALSCYYLGCIS